VLWLSGEQRGDFEINIEAARREKMAIRRRIPRGTSCDELPDLSGSLVVPTMLSRTLYEYLEAGIAGFRIGASVVNTATGEPIQFPTVGAHAIAAGSIPQGTAIAGTDPTFGRVQLDSYKYGQLVAVSSELVSIRRSTSRRGWPVTSAVASPA
jgi:HK97 family phage major capsid protein